jgi:uncharacterized membrane protein
VLFIQRIEAVLLISPILILLGTFTGVANGVISGLLIEKISEEPA